MVLAGASSRREVAEAVGRVLDVEVRVDGGVEHLHPDRAVIIMYTDADEPSVYLVEVRAHTDEAQHALAERIYRGLVEATNWSLRWESELPGPDLLAERP